MFLKLCGEENYFAKRLSLKTLYQSLVKYENLRKEFVKNLPALKMMMQLILDDNKGI